jgi:hypothetical protein
LREPAITRSAVAVARPPSTSSIMSLIANPCACRMPSGSRYRRKREQFKRTDAVGLDVTPVASGRHSPLSTGLCTVLNRYLDTLFQ